MGILLLLIGAGFIVYELVQNQANASSLTDAFSDTWNDIQTAGEDTMSSIEGWQSVDEGPTWVPVINATEAALGIPTNLLARMAYQESHFRPDIIDGTTASSAGALGILQLEPQYFTSVNVARPYTAQDTTAQISEAGNYLMQMYHEFNDWGNAVAAYNAGPGTVQNVLAGSATLPQETQNYVQAIFADVPVTTTQST